MGDAFFPEVTGRIPFGGLDATEPLAFRVYDPDRIVLGKRMEDHLRIGVCLWHSFAWAGRDMFGVGTFDRPWLDPAVDPMTAARQKMAVAFEFIEKLGMPWYCFHDRDVAPEGASFAEFRDNLDALTDDALALPGAGRGTAPVGHGQPVHASPLPGRRGDEPGSGGLRLRSRPGQAHARGHPTARRHELCSVGWPRGLRHPPQHRPEAGRRAARAVPPSRGRAQAQDRLRGQPPDRAEADGADEAPVRLRLGDHPRLPRPERPGGRVPPEHRGEPRDPRRALVPPRGRLRGRERDASASIDANRGDPQNGWDTDQFPNSVEDLALPIYEILRAGGLTTGGFNFDAKLRRQSTDRNDLFHAHIGGIDTLARALLVAAELVERQTLSTPVEARYAGWNGPLGSAILDGRESLATLEAMVASGEIDPRPVSGGQERLENVVNEALWSAARAAPPETGTGR